MSEKAAYSIAEAAAMSGLSPDFIKRSIHITQPTAERPVLAAKKAGVKYLILASELHAWLKSLPDA